MADFEVLLPLDGSPLAEHSLAFLPALARGGRVRARLLAVVDETHDSHDLREIEAGEHERHAMTAYLRDIQEKLEKQPGVSTEIEVKAGVPAEIILERAEALSPDLLIISTHGRSGVARWRRGSVADKVIRGVTCSILVVGPKAAEEGDWLETESTPAFDNILVPLDGSPLAEQALPIAQSFASSFEAKLHLFRAVPIPSSGVGIGFELGQIMDEIEEAAQTYLDEAAQKVQAPGGVVARIQIGTPTLLLEDYIANQSVDLVVMTSHGRSGLVRAALGSMTDRLLGNGTAPILVVRSSDSAN